MIKTATALTGAALLLAAAPAVAGEAATDLVVSTRVVSTGDLDLFSSGGRLALDRRIAAAARAVCREEAPTNSRIAAAELACREAALASANRQRDRIFAMRGVMETFRSAARSR